MSIRWVLTKAQWDEMEPHCLGKVSDPGRSGQNNRLFVEAVLWIVRTGSPWRDLPPELGKWNTALQALSRLGQGRCVQTHVRCGERAARHGVRHGGRHHCEGASAWSGCKRGTSNQAIGRSRGGLTTKILALTDFDVSTNLTTNHARTRPGHSSMRCQRVQGAPGNRHKKKAPNATSHGSKMRRMAMARP